MSSHSDPLAEPTVGVPTPPPAGGPAETAPQQEPHQRPGPPQHDPTYGAPAYGAPPYGHDPYPLHAPGTGMPYGSQYDAPPGYPTPQRSPRAPRGDRGTLVAACLAFLVVVLGAPALVVAWRSAVGPSVVTSGLVAGVLVVTGLAVLAVGVFPLVTSRGDARHDTGPASLLRPPVVLALVGAILLVGAAIAV